MFVSLYNTYYPAHMYLKRIFVTPKSAVKSSRQPIRIFSTMTNSRVQNRAGQPGYFDWYTEDIIIYYFWYFKQSQHWYNNPTVSDTSRRVTDIIIIPFLVLKGEPLIKRSWSYRFWYPKESHWYNDPTVFGTPRRATDIIILPFLVIQREPLLITLPFLVLKGETLI